MARLEPREVELPNGRRCRIRSLEAEDAAASLEHRHRFNADAPLVLTKADEVPTDIEQQRTAIVQRLERPTELLVGAFLDGRQVATGGLHQPALRRKVRHVVELGIGVEAPCRGIGLGRALMVAMLDFAAAHPQIIQVWLNVYPQNTPAVRLYESLGFSTQYVRRNYFLHDDGTFHDDSAMMVYVKRGKAHAGCGEYPPGAGR